MQGMGKLICILKIFFDGAMAVPSMGKARPVFVFFIKFYVKLRAWDFAEALGSLMK